MNRGEKAERDLPPPSGKIGQCTRSHPGVRQTCNDGGQLERAERALGGPEGGRWELGCVVGPQVGANDGGQLEWGEWALGDPKGGPLRASPGRRARVSQAFPCLLHLRTDHSGFLLVECSCDSQARRWVRTRGFNGKPRGQRADGGKGAQEGRRQRTECQPQRPHMTLLSVCPHAPWQS